MGRDPGMGPPGLATDPTSPGGLSADSIGQGAIVVGHMHSPLSTLLQQEGFLDDSVRMMRQLQAANKDLQILLFSATFNERVKTFAQKAVKDANQVRD